ncbi:YciI family protein [Sinorhizobium numidicum]|uniref:YciI family protein n=1 Tax=Sinorhizobium numidicum TaxID=680248 RepID=A0ABY8CSE3_9HYPH|nr:YciI family protein [Sinorhizobium numidicum]WEX73946.1 YciI family protein [Sinorhizobium numidicum]WEX79931.1 YciI family protein [Sinorhizobium numidicum]
MNYLCQFWFETSTSDELSEEQKQKLTEDCRAYDDGLTESGHLILAQALRPPATAKTVRVSDSKISVTDGPFAEIKEYLGGIILIKAEDMDEALRIASRSPLARFAALEVRPAYSIKEKH